MKKTIFNYDCLICHEKFQSDNKLLIQEFISNHIHDKITNIKCLYCGFQFKKENIIAYADVIEICTDHECFTMETLKAEKNEEEEREEAKQVMLDYKTHY